MSAEKQHYEKTAAGHWMLQFGKHRGTLLSEVPCAYLHWMLSKVRFVQGDFRKAVLRTLRVRHGQGCTLETCDDYDCEGLALYLEEEDVLDR